MSDFTDSLNKLNRKMAKVAMEKKAVHGIEKEAYLGIMGRYLRKQATDNYVTLRNQYLGSNAPTGPADNPGTTTSGVAKGSVNSKTSQEQPRAKTKREILKAQQQKLRDWNNQSLLRRMWQARKMQ